MAAAPALDLDLVRTLVLIAEEKSFTRAAERVGRTQSAVSLQVQRLEALVGRTLIARGKGGAVELTAYGEELVKRGRELLALNEDILRSLQVRPSHDSVRLAVDEGYTRGRLPEILQRFADSHPETTVEVARGSSCEFVSRLKSGELDLLLCGGGLEPPGWPAVELWRGRLTWIIEDTRRRHLDDPLPLSLSPGNCPFRPPWLDDCIWRKAALRSLDLAGRRYRIVSTGSTAEAQLAAVSAGLAVTAALPHDLPEGLRIAGVSDGLPQLPEVSLLMVKSREPRQPATDALHAHIVETFGAKSHAA